MMARRMMRKHHVRCRAGEKVEITSKPYLSLSVLVECGKMLKKGWLCNKSPQYHKLCKIHALQSFRLYTERKGYSETCKHDYSQHQRRGTAIR